MPKIRYVNINLRPERAKIVQQANEIVGIYVAQGYDLSLRQLYYQFVARDLFPEDWADPQTGSTNNIRSYKKLQDIINDARLGGMIDWDHITDRTRFVRSVSTWGSPQSILDSCVRSYKTDKWKGQKYRIEVWIEKDALVGVIEPVCNDLEVSFLACRGYVSQSEVWGAAQRLLAHLDGNQVPVIIHLGDHDPSGIDMSRDIKDRLNLFLGGRKFEFERIALNMDQVEKYNPPSNPAKLTDSRCGGYMDKFGDESWELDALEPTVIGSLIRDTVKKYRNDKIWKADLAKQESDRATLHEIEDRYDDIKDYLAE